MFPENAHFICRKCLNKFYIDKDLYERVRHAKKYGCPKCRSIREEKPNETECFFRFYPRLVDAAEAMKKTGFQWTGYSYGKYPMMGFFYFTELVFRCLECSGSFNIPFETVQKLANEPQFFFCPKCKINPRHVRHTKEFFICIKNVHKSAWLNNDFQWDIFSPLGESPDLYEIQS